MFKPAVELYNTLFREAIDCNTIKGFKHLAEMTTAHAERRIISLLKAGVLYTYNGRFIVKYFNRLCVISLNKKKEAVNVGTFGYTDINGVQHTGVYEEHETLETVRIDLPFSPKHVCGGVYKCRDIRRVEDASILNHVLMAIVD